jgi:N-acetylneuraminic acid mutarotase
MANASRWLIFAVLAALSATCVRAFESTTTGPVDAALSRDASAEVRRDASEGPIAGEVTTKHGGSDDPSWSGTVTDGTVVDSDGVYLAERSGFEVKSARLPGARAWATAATLGDSIWIAGGASDVSDSTQLDDVIRYVPVSDSSSTSSMHLAKGLSQSVAVPLNGMIYVVKGLDSLHTLEGSVHALNPAVSTVTISNPASIITANRHAAAAVGQLIYVFGGYGTGPLRAEIQTFDPKSTVATTVGSLQTVGLREKLRACAAPNGKIYLFGGNLVQASDPTSCADGTDEILEFTPGTSAPSVVAKLPVALCNTAVGVLHSGKIVIAGGEIRSGVTSKRTDAVYEFDPQTRAVTTAVDKLPTPLTAAAYAVGSNGKLYLFGGRSATALSDGILELRPYTKDGRRLGPVIDTGAPGSRWLQLDWHATAGSGTQIELAVRASDTLFAQDTTTIAWAPVSGPAPVTQGLPSGRYLQWGATLNTSNTAISPTLSWVTLRYKRP